MNPNTGLAAPGRLASAVPNTPTAETFVATSIREVLGLCERTEQANTRIAASLDRLLGGVPEDGAKSTPQPVPNGQWGELAAAAQRLARAIERTHELVSRLETFA